MTLFLLSLSPTYLSTGSQVEDERHPGEQEQQQSRRLQHREQDQQLLHARTSTDTKEKSKMKQCTRSDYGPNPGSPKCRAFIWHETIRHVRVAMNGGSDGNGRATEFEIQHLTWQIKRIAA